MTGENNTAKQCLSICPLFEAELLVQLMLQNWQHPWSSDYAFRQQLLESATELLSVASQESCSEVFIEGVQAKDMNLISAIWYVEWCAVQDEPEERENRQRWLDDVRRALPSCFCPPDLLGS